MGRTAQPLPQNFKQVLGLFGERQIVGTDPTGTGTQPIQLSVMCLFGTSTDEQDLIDWINDPEHTERLGHVYEIRPVWAVNPVVEQEQ